MSGTTPRRRVSDKLRAEMDAIRDEYARQGDALPYGVERVFAIVHELENDPLYDLSAVLNSMAVAATRLNSVLI